MLLSYAGARMSGSTRTSGVNHDRRAEDGRPGRTGHRRPVGLLHESGRLESGLCQTTTGSRSPPTTGGGSACRARLTTCRRAGPNSAYPQQAHLDFRVPDVAAATDAGSRAGRDPVARERQLEHPGDPAGHPFDLCLKADDPKTTLMGVMLDCPDVKELSTFYVQLLGKPITYEGEGMAMIGQEGDSAGHVPAGRGLSFGKPVTEAGAELSRGVGILRYYAQQALDPDGETYPGPSPAGLLLARRRPRGVAGLITPWNFPVAIPLWKAAPALAFGNAVLLKPSPDATGLRPAPGRAAGPGPARRPVPGGARRGRDRQGAAGGGRLRLVHRLGGGGPPGRRWPRPGGASPARPRWAG